ncbi:DUF2785 domain-containing protein [Nocardioides guangzhouensis]|uniref:DUF2785 domain-containing protein n=1 Tax=Nocardioides guangzhouensis TaxID=2497878 RepID=A0A4Q4Z3K3_9ACTN|nr:DUF2785 domain-containing protein [Nocardioides guangzhouensis]RYP82267.1 DUF2785 domain-containing protein [Nocardioides guangzhouensis]
MASGFWDRVVTHGHQVPQDRPLDDLTAELTTMLGSPDAHLRDRVGYSTLATWIHRGVYDELLTGLGDGMAAGLENGLGDNGSDTVFRRSFSALLLGECVARDNEERLLPDNRILRWGDRIAAWYVREQDLRGYVPGKGWAHAAAHGADAIAALAQSAAMGAPELTVLLDVMADRLLLPTDEKFVTGEPDRMAAAVLAVLRRNLVPLSVLEPWIGRLANGARPGRGDNPWADTFNVQEFLRALHLHLALGGQRPAVRSDLLLALVDALRSTNPHYLTGE